MDYITRKLAELLIRDRERALRHADENRDLPQLRARYTGEADGYGYALAYIAGLHGYGTREALEADIAAKAVQA